MPGLCHLVLGPMFAKKTTRVIMYKRRLDKKGSLTLIFKHYSDMRYDNGFQVTSHDKDSEHCIPIHNTSEIFNNENYDKADVIIIEEGQFFDVSMVEDCRKIVNSDGKYLIISALSGDYKMRPFGHIHELLCIATSVEMATAYCEYCDDVVDASYTVKIDGSNDQVEVGVDKYAPVCRKHHLMHSNYALEKDLPLNNNNFTIELNEMVNKIVLHDFPESNYNVTCGNTYNFIKQDNEYNVEIPEICKSLHICNDKHITGYVTYFTNKHTLYCWFKKH